MWGYSSSASRIWGRPRPSPPGLPKPSDLPQPRRIASATFRDALSRCTNPASWLRTCWRNMQPRAIDGGAACSSASTTTSPGLRPAAAAEVIHVRNSRTIHALMARLMASGARSTLVPMLGEARRWNLLVRWQNSCVNLTRMHTHITFPRGFKPCRMPECLYQRARCV